MPCVVLLLSSSIQTLLVCTHVRIPKYTYTLTHTRTCAHSHTSPQHNTQGPSLSIEVPSLNFGLVQVGHKSTLAIPIWNGTCVPVKFAVSPSSLPSGHSSMVVRVALMYVRLFADAVEDTTYFHCSVLRNMAAVMLWNMSAGVPAGSMYVCMELTYLLRTNVLTNFGIIL